MTNKLLLIQGCYGGYTLANVALKNARRVAWKSKHFFWENQQMQKSIGPHAVRGTKGISLCLGDFTTFSPLPCPFTYLVNYEIQIHKVPLHTLDKQ